MNEKEKQQIRFGLNHFGENLLSQHASPKQAQLHNFTCAELGRGEVHTHLYHFRCSQVTCAVLCLYRKQGLVLFDNTFVVFVLLYCNFWRGRLCSSMSRFPACTHRHKVSHTHFTLEILPVQEAEQESY